MEIKATLNKPYTSKQYADFVVENNHKKGYEIRVTKEAAEAWANTEEEMQEQEKQAQAEALRAELDTLDLKAIRPLRAIQAGVGTEEDRERLTELEMLAVQIREELNDLVG